ncbi:MAG: oligosaccharide flippase family protein [Selenomonadaceae bacterium]|nr:oligosaccharide flippase family protein [Selenomonadaceae bacterium]
MARSRSAYAKYNILYALIFKIYQMIVPFIVRTLMIYRLGMEYVGLTGLFSSLLGVLSFAELGIGTAIVYSLYQPVAEGDTATINATIKFYRKCWRIIGTVIVFLGLAILPFLPWFVNYAVPEDVNIYVLYLLQLATTAVTYFMFSYRECLFIAHQRNDLSSKIGVASSSITYMLQIAVLLFVRNYTVYLAVALLGAVCRNFMVAFVSRKYYPQFVCQGELPKETIDMLVHKVKALVVVKLGDVILYSVDGLIISTFLGLTVLGVYSSYYVILSSVIGLVGLITASIVSSIGNSLVTETKEKNYRSFQALAHLNFWVVGAVAAVFLITYQSFMECWIGQESLLDTEIPGLLVLSFYILQSNQVLGAYKDAAGIWTADRYRPLITATVNLTLNLILVQFVGLVGVVLSTVAALLLVNTPWLAYNVCKLVFQTTPYRYAVWWVKNLVINLLVIGVVWYVGQILPVTGWLGFIIRGLVGLVLANILLAGYHFNSRDFGMSRELLKKIIPSISI